MGTVRERFVVLVLEGSSDRHTIEKALSTALTERSKLGAIAKDKAADLLVRAMFSVMELLPVFAVRLAPEGSGVEDIPSPACMEKHLPKDRKWTEDDIQRAWNACLKNISK
jgi:hypothetical protein